MALNDPRTIPFAFRVVALDGCVWLYDDSSRTYACSSSPLIWAEPLYTLDLDEDDDGAELLPDPNYWAASTIEQLDSEPLDLDLDPDDISPDTCERYAWDAAREAAHADHRI